MERRKKELEFVLSQKQQEIDEKLKKLPKQKGSPRLQKTLKYASERTMLSPSEPLNPPTLCNTHLQEFTQHAYATLNASLDITILKLRIVQEPRQFPGWDVYTVQQDVKQAAISEFQENITDLIRVLRSLYQWIHEEDKEVSQEALECLLQTLLSSFWQSIYHSEESHRGGFRNLLLDGWWLEFWEIILLAAGDVERNPGPIDKAVLAQVSNTPLDEDDLSEVFEAVLPASSNWRMLCCYLGLPPSLLDTIRNDHLGDTRGSLFEGLQQWIQRNYNTKKHGVPTWRNLVEAIDNPAGGNSPKLALEIATKHEKFDPLQATKECTEPSVVVSSQVAIALVVKSHKACQTSEDSDLVRSRQMCSDFNKMYRSIVSQLRVNVKNVKDFLRYLHNPRCCAELCVPPNVYENATTTKDLLSRLSPEYVKPEDTFVLEEIVSEFGSPRCKNVLKDYIDEYL